MTPRDLPCPAPRAGALRALSLACALLATCALPRVTYADIQTVTVRPEFLSSCDSMTIRVEGWTASSCQVFEGGSISGPVPIPEWVGPLPPLPAYRYDVRVDVDSLQGYGDCVPDIVPYVLEFRVGSLPPGLHLVNAVERVRDRITLAPLPDTSVASTSFTVAPSDSCWPSCSLLSFASPDPTQPVESRCDARAQPGGVGCFDVRLVNTEPVGGVQMEIAIIDIQLTVPGAVFSAKSVTPIGRADSLQVAWEGDGNRLKAILFSANGKMIAPGQGPILRVCYEVGATTSSGAYYITLPKALVANADGIELPPCPTFRQEAGYFCVGLEPTCDLNDDGASDIRDIIRLARCALAGDACPADIAARADCDGDGGVDVRDIICCARTMLARGAWSGAWTAEYPASGQPTVVGFTGAPEWDSETSGHATVEVGPGDGFGGLQFSLIPPPGIRIASLDLGPHEGSYELVWHRGNTGRIFAMLYRTSDSEPVASPVPIDVRFEPSPGTSAAAAWGTLRVVTPLASTWDGERAGSEIRNGEASLPETAPAALRISRARPNPFAVSTEVEFSISAPGPVSVRVYDVAGRLVRSVLRASMPSGVHRVSWDGRDGRGRSVPAGLYFVRVGSAGSEKTTRILKLR